MTGIIGIIMVFSIPIIAIWTSYKIKMKKIENEENPELNNNLKRQLGVLMNENELLKERIESLETIVSKLPQISEDERKILIGNKEISSETDDSEKWREIDLNTNKNNLFR